MIQQCLHEAVSGGNLKIVKLLINAGVDVNLVSGDSKTAVMIASSEGYIEVVKVLVGNGADVNLVPGHNQFSPLLYASWNGYVNTVKFPIKAGADVNFTRDEDHSTALLMATSNDHVNIVKVLVESGANVNSVNIVNETALMKAASYGHVNSIEALIAAGADVNHSLEDGWSVLMSTASNGHLDCLQYLIHVQDPRHFSHYPFDEAIGSHNDREDFPWNKYQSVKFHCPRKDVASWSVTVSSAVCAQLLVTSGADVNKTTENGWTALHLASLDGHLDIVKSLLKLGAKVNAQSAIRWTPLIAAIVGKHYQCVRTLLRAGADVNTIVRVWHSANWEEKTALNFALDVDSTDIAQLLLYYGVHVDRPSISTRANTKLRKLLRVAGDSSYSIIDINYSEGARIEYGRCFRKFSLKSLSDQCRRVIRKHLLEVNRNSSLFHTVRCLEFPAPLQEYLLFDVTLKCPSILRGQSQGLCEQMLVFYRTI